MSTEFIMLVGLPGSGKSTWVKKFLASSQKDYTVISSDDIIEEYAEKNGIDYNQAFNEYDSDAMKQMNINAKQAVNNNENIIWDQTNTSAKSRAKKLKLAEHYDSKIAVVFVTDVPELKRRLETRAEQTGKHIPEYVLKSMSNKYDIPSKEEGFDKILYVRD